MSYLIYSIFLLNFIPHGPKLQDNLYFKNLSPIENNLNNSNFKETLSYQKTPYLIVKNHKISN